MSMLSKWWEVVQRASADEALRNELSYLRAKYCDDRDALAELLAKDPALPSRLKGYEHELRIRGFDLDDDRDRRDGYAWAFDVHVERLSRVVDLKNPD
jgi:hypothetical protein